jgi:hypothetical protein
MLLDLLGGGTNTGFMELSVWGRVKIKKQE